MKIYEVDAKFINPSDTAFSKMMGGELYHNSLPGKKRYMPFKFRNNPRDTLTPFHNEVNMLSKQHLGMPVRSLLFALKSLSDLEAIRTFGTIYKTFPVSDNFRIFYAPNIRDMTIDLSAEPSWAANETYIEVENVLYKNLINQDDVDRKMLSKGVYQKIQWVFEYNDDDPSMNIDEYFNNCFAEVKKFLNRKGIEYDIINEVEDAFIRTRVKLQNKAYQYVMSIEEVSPDDDMSSIGGDIELMVYDPRGFILDNVK